MAEKEERIYVRQYGEDNPCDTCEDKSGDGCDFCVKNYEWNSSIPRQEAIEKIAKAICANEDEYADCKQCEFNGPEDCKRYYRNNWLYTAEAALNALLEGK